jgi:hypothetical protein
MLLEVRVHLSRNPWSKLRFGPAVIPVRTASDHLGLKTSAVVMPKGVATFAPRRDWSM